MHVFGFGDKSHFFQTGKSRLLEDAFEVGKVLAVHDQQLVFVELHFQRNRRIEHGDSRAAVVENHVFEIAESALEDGQVDVLAVEIVMPTVAAFMARLENHVDFVPQGIEQFEKHVEQTLARGRSHQYGDVDARLFVPVNVVPVSRSRDDLQVERWPYGAGQQKIAVTSDLHVGRSEEHTSELQS